MGDTVIVTAIDDRLLHRSHVLNIHSKSYKVIDKRQAGLATSHRLLTSAPEETQIEGQKDECDSYPIRRKCTEPIGR